MFGFIAYQFQDLLRNNAYGSCLAWVEKLKKNRRRRLGGLLSITKMFWEFHLKEWKWSLYI